MKHLLFLILSLASVSIPTVLAEPSADLRVIVIDPLGGGFDGAITYSSVPFNDDIFSLNNAGELDAGEHVAVYGGDVFVTNVERISKINLDASGLPDPALGSNIEHITDPIFIELQGIAIDDNGMIYAADSNEIYLINPSGAPTAAATAITTDQSFATIEDIVIDNNFLYILDTGADNGGAVYKIALPISGTNTVTLVYSGNDDEPIVDAKGMAVRGNDVFVSVTAGTPLDIGVLRISGGVADLISDNSGNELSFPVGLVVDDPRNDLYLTDGSTIYRLDLDTIPSPPIPEIVDLLDSPVGLAIMEISGQAPQTDLTLTKTANTTSALPGQGILYTLTATNNGPDDATSVLIHDFFPSGGNGQIESFINPQTNQLSFTSTVHTSGGTFSAGSCERRDANPVIVDCSGFGPLAAGDFVVVTLEGFVRPGAQGDLTNTANVENFGESASASVTTSVSSVITLSSVTKTASSESVVAGDDTLDYTIRVEHFDASTDAHDVLITDKIPKGLSSLTITSQPLPNSCQLTPNVDGTTDLQCGPYHIEDEDFVEIRYTSSVGPDATNPLVNGVDVTCSNCASVQSASDSTTVIKQSDLSIEKISDKDSVIAGQDDLVYTITVSNDGISDADNVIITDNLPAGVSFNAAGTSAECSYDSGNHDVVCNIPNSLVVGNSHTVTINTSVDSDASGTLTNTATVDSDSEDANPGNNQQSVDVEANSIADLALSKTGPTDMVAGQLIKYDLTVTNNGLSTATNVIVEDYLPAGLVFVPSTAPGSLTDPSCTENLQTVTCTFGSVGPGITQTKSIQAKIGLDVVGILENNAEVFTDTEESNPDDNFSTITTAIAPPFCGRADTDFDSIIYGTAGNDHIKGTNGDDLIFGLGGNDKIHGKNGDDCIFGGDGDDKIWGGKGNDTIEGNNGKDHIHGQQGNDAIFGGDGDDKIWGGQGSDTIDAGAGNDKVHGNQDVDNIVGGDGDDWLSAGIGDDIVYAGAGNDKVYGKQGHDQLFGESGNDIIHGGQGNDLLNGGADNDQCHGAQGTNTFVDCESKKPMNEDDDEEEEDENDNEHDDDNGNNGNNGNHGNNGNNGNHGNNGNNGNHGNNGNNGNDKGKKK